MVIFPLTFLSSAFVPLGGLPAGLRTVAAWNPISAIIAATRTLFGNPTALPSEPSLAAAAPGARGPHLVPRAACALRAACDLALPRSHSRLTRQAGE